MAHLSICTTLLLCGGASWVVLVVKNLPVNAGDVGSVPGLIPWRRAWQLTPVFLPGEWTGGSWCVTDYGAAKSWAWLSDERAAVGWSLLYSTGGVVAAGRGLLKIARLFLKVATQLHSGWSGVRREQWSQAFSWMSGGVRAQAVFPPWVKSFFLLETSKIWLSGKLTADFHSLKIYGWKGETASSPGYQISMF